ncbi:MAG TPA: thioredoxin family protein [Kiritimatiellia bacterium]
MKMKGLIAGLMVSAALTGVRADGVATGDAAPDFTLKDVDGKDVSLAGFKGKYVVLEWVNHGCPFVKKHYGPGNMQGLQSEFGGKGVTWLSICSSAEGNQGYEKPEDWKKLNADKKSAATDVLLDPDGTVGHAYNAKTTPHMFVIDPDGKVIYQGAIDSIKSTESDDIKKANNYVRAALDEALAGKPVTRGTTEPYGCGVKYK